MRAVACPVIIGRDAEVEALIEAVESAVRGRGQVAFVVGEAGIGKSRLAAAASAAAASRGLTVLHGRAVASGAAVPYRPWSEALLSVLRGLPPPPATELIPFGPALARLVPGWDPDGHVAGLESVVALGEGLLRLLRVLGADHGTVVVLEDVHWADPDSLAVLEYLADKLTGEPVLIIATARPEHGGPALDLAVDTRSRRLGLHLELRRLGPEEAAAMAGACLGVPRLPDGVDEVIGSYADGLPFLVEELLASLVAAGSLVRSGAMWHTSGTVRPEVPLTFSESFSKRVASLPERARRLLACAGLLGRHFDWSLLGPALDLDDDVVLELLGRVAAAHLVEEDAAPDRFRFRHALSRDASLGLVVGPDRASLARRLAVVVEQRYPGLPGEWCLVAADLAAEAGDHRTAATLLTDAASRALERGALATATSVAQRAVQQAAPDDNGTQIEAGKLLVAALALAGDPSRAMDRGAWLLQRMEANGASAGDVAAVHLELARSAAAAASWDLALIHLEAARRAGGEQDDASFGASLSVLSAQVELGRHRPEEAARLAEAALAAAPEPPPGVRCEALEVLGRVARLGDWRQAEAYFTQALETATSAGLVLWKVRALGELGIQDIFTAGPSDRLELVRRMAADAGAVVAAAHADLHLAVIHQLHHDIDAGLAAAERAEAAARRYKLPLLLAVVLSNRALLELSRGQRHRAAELADEALSLSGGDPQVEANIRGLPFTLSALVGDDRAAARRELERAVAAMPPRSDAASGPFADMLLLLVAVDGDLTPQLWTRLAPAGRNRHALGNGFFHAAGAVEAGRAGNHADAVDAVRTAGTELAAMPLFHQLMLRLVAEAALEAGWGEPVVWLRQAAVFFKGTGLSDQTAACQALLRRAGAPLPRRRAGDRPVPAPLEAMGVTARELDVLTLVGQGLTNRAIAQRLYLSVRTVEKHVERLLAKTGSATRAQLAALAARLPDHGT